ncbi:homocysteine S-methyltransferase [Brachybacterium phenoliresistens]|uniref:homocysteine S-methyltransferase n=1 Tax=Brachybacterium phenoliresistens TaxID=396014 RepID=UPI0031DDDD3D
MNPAAPSAPSFADVLADRSAPPRVLDGGLGTHLADRGLDVTGELWSAQILRERPEEVRAAHADFFAAGAQVATSCSYQVTADGLARAGAAPAELEQLLRASVDLARQAADAPAAAGTDGDARAEGSRGDGDPGAAPAVRGSALRLVAASIGPYGAGPGAGTEYDGAYGLSARELAAWHRPRLEILADTAADVLLAETVPSIREVEALAGELEGLRVPAMLSMTVREGALGDGTDLREAARVLRGSSLVAVGVNCCPVPDAVAALRILAEELDVPLLAYPNSGEVWDQVHRRWLPGEPGADLPGAVPQLAAAGARLIGGCCRVGPAQIARVAGAVAQQQGPSAG